MIAARRKIRFFQIIQNISGRGIVETRKCVHLPGDGKITMNKAASNNSLRVKCAWCGGTGQWRVAPGNKASCVVCGGGGLVSVAGRASECRQCGGSGKSGDFRPCLTCAGTGWERVLGQ